MSLANARNSHGAFFALVFIATLLISGLVAPSSAHADMTFRINGGGFGHGIGLSQYGAKGFAERTNPKTGNPYQYHEIVRWYFGGSTDGSKAGVSLPTLAQVGKHENPTVKVNIDDAYSGRDSWTLRAYKSKLSIYDNSGKLLRTLPTVNGNYIFEVYGSSIRVARTYTYNVPIRVVPEVTAGVSPALIVVGNQSGPFDRQYVRYRGEMQLKVIDATVNGAVVKKLRAVNALPMQEYLYGVVPRESPSSWPLEALKAQAVVARSYAWASNPPSATDTTTLSGILHCNTWSQVYGGHSRLVNSDDADITPYETANTAVNQTYDRIVYHIATKKIIQTFFSSSSGGHTASIEDVWGGSTPQPYYKGVADADQNGPDYRWPTVYKTGAELAAAFRAKDGSVRDYTEAAPATVIGMSHDKAASGYVRNAIVRWSNGKSHTVDGDIVRSALGLKSTKFTILGPAWGPLIQETDPKISWEGSWGVWKSTAHSGGAYKYSWQQGAKSTFSFMGTGFRWYALKWPKGGQANVLVDGVKVASVNLYSPTNKYHQAVYTATGLSVNAPHTVSIEVLRTKDASSSGYAVGVDALRVQSGALVPTVP